MMTIELDADVDEARGKNGNGGSILESGRRSSSNMAPQRINGTSWPQRDSILFVLCNFTGL
jgi:hypothetical protein